jgi:hypothetical protein
MVPLRFACCDANGVEIKTGAPEKSAEERLMRKHAWFLSLAILLVAAAALVAVEDPNMGTWILNEGKSKITGNAKNTKVVYEAAGDSIKVTVDGVDKDGKAIHNEWTGKFDGKDYPLTGDSTADTRSYKKTGTHTLTLDNKKGGKTILTGKVTIAADGKSRTLVSSGTDADGKKISSTFVYDKQ